MGRGRFKERSHLLLLCLFGTYSGLGAASRGEEGKLGPGPALGSPPAAPGPPRRAAGCVRGELRTSPPSTGRPSPLGPRALSRGPITNYTPSPHGSLQTAGETAAPLAETSRGGPSPPRPRAPLRCRAPRNSSTTDAAVFGFHWKGKVCLTWRHVLPFFPSLKQHKGSGLSRRKSFEIK